MTPDAFNAWRVFPRLLCILYGAMMWRVVEWYMALGPNATPEQSAFGLTVVATAAAWFKYYVESGPVFGRQPTRGDRQ